MKNILIAAIAALGFTATTASAFELPIPGLELNTQVVAEYKVDAETATLVSTPELAYSPAFAKGLTATAGIEIDVWSKAGGFTLADQFDVKPEILLGVTYVPPVLKSLELELGTSYDFEAAKRSEITLVATFNF